jgi:hypothetical protein
MTVSPDSNGWRSESSTLRQHGLAGTGWANHQQVMPAGGRNLQRTLGGFLSADIGKVGQRAFRLGDACFRPRQYLRAAEMIGDGDETARREDRHLAARPCGFGSRTGGTDDAAAGAVGGNRRGQYAGDRRDRAIQRQLAEGDEIGQLLAGHGAHCGHQRERDREIVVAPLFGQIGRGEIDDDPPLRKREAGRMQRAPHPLGGFGYGFVGEAYDQEFRQAGNHLHLHINGDRFDPLKCNCRDVRDHYPAPVCNHA